MFIRKTKKIDKKTKKEYYIYQLVKSYRTEIGPRQKILLNLGTELCFLSESDRKQLANRIEEILSGIKTFFETPLEIEKLAKTFSKQVLRKEALVEEKKTILNKEEQEFHSIDINSLEHEQAKTVGLEHIAYETYKKLQIEKKLIEAGLTKRQIEILTGIIIGKLVKPGSELSTYNWLKKCSGIDELMGSDFNRLSLNMVYQASDNLLKHKDVLEEHLTNKEQNLFSLNNTIILYDLTNTFFEGRAEGIQKAKRGHSKERRNDAPLVTLGLVLNKFGFPIKSKILPGNISEPSTLQEAIEDLGNKTTPIIVIDAGIATKKNLEFLREKKYKYIVSKRSRSCETPSDVSLEVIKEKKDQVVKVGEKDDLDTGEKLIYCHSKACENKEIAMRSFLQKRFESSLKMAHEALFKKRGIKTYNKVLEKIGRLKERHNKISSNYKITVEASKDKKKAISITWKEISNKLKNRFQGAYILRTYGLDWNAKDLWETYMMLTKVEEGFRCLKSELGLRPVFHKIDRRVEGHLFITVIAYHIMQTVLYQLRSAGIFIRWEKLRCFMSTQVRVTTTMKTKDSKNLHFRSSTNPDSFHQEIYRALKLSQKPGKKTKVFM
jgi:transposase